MRVAGSPRNPRLAQAPTLAPTLTVLSLLAAVGGCCGAGRIVPIRTEPEGEVQLLGWEELEVTGDRLRFSAGLRGAGGLQVLLDGREVVGCLRRPRPAGGAVGAEVGAAALLHCALDGLEPGDHRLVVAAARLYPPRSLRERGLAVEPPAPEAGRDRPVAGRWWSPWGWEHPVDAGGGEALARWVRVGPADPREGVRTSDEQEAEAIGATAAADSTTAEQSSHVPVLPDPAVGQALAAFLRGELAAAALAEILQRWPNPPDAAGPLPGLPLLGPADLAATGLPVDALVDAAPSRSEQLKLAWTVQLALGGVPLVYNAAATGALGGTLRSLVATRRAHRALSLGRLRVVAARQDVLVLLKLLSGEGATVTDLALVAVNRGARPALLDEPMPPELTRGALLHDALGGQAVQLAEGRLVLELPPGSAMLLVAGLP